MFKVVIFCLIACIRASFAFENGTKVNCTQYRDVFSNYVSSFTSCAIENSRPVTLCESCIDTYINVLDSYNNMSEFSDDDGPCISNYVNLDRLQILETMYRSSYDLWNRAKCYECFEIVNGKLTHNRSKVTIEFDNLLNTTLTCIDNANRTSHGNSSHICWSCMQKYLDLNDFYFNMINENDKIAGCMDVVDLMNGTRTYWSETCCRYRRKPEYIFIASTISMFFITILFYILAKVCTDKRSPSIFQQSRFAVSFNGNANGTST